MNQPDIRRESDHEGQLLARWTNPPGHDAEFYPEDLRQLALSLLEAAQALNEETTHATEDSDLGGAILRLADMSSKGYSVGSLLKQLRYIEKLINER